MKKTLSVILALVMVLSCSITLLTYVAADDTVTPVAPTVLGAQDTIPTGNTQKIRFLSTLNELVGEKLGYIITAEYKDGTQTKKLSFSGQDYESDQVFKTVRATEESGSYKTVSASQYGAEYFFPITIGGVPTDKGEVLFTVQTYVVYGGTTTYSETKQLQWEDGNFNEILITQDFDEFKDDNKIEVKDIGSTDTDNVLSNALANVDWSIERLVKWTGTNNVSFVDGEATLLLAGSTVKVIDDAKLKNANKYTLEMDLAVQHLGWFNIMFNNDGTGSSAVGVNAGKSSGDNFLNLSFRYYNNGSTGAIADSVESGTYGVSFHKNNTGNNNGVATLVAFKDTSVNIGNTARVRIEVDNFAKTVSLYIGENTVIDAASFPESMNYAGGIYFQSQNGKVTVDNIKVYGDVKATAAAGTELYREYFNDIESLPWNVLYDKKWGSLTAKVDITGDAVALTDHGGTAYEIVADELLYGLDAYTVEMDLSFNSISTAANLIFNSSSPLKGTDMYTATGEWVQFRNYNENEEMKGGSYELRFRQVDYTYGNTDYSPSQNQVDVQTIGAFKDSNDTAITYHIKVEVVCGQSITVTVTGGDIDGAVVSTRTTNINKNASGVYLMVQGIDMTVDNVVAIAGVSAN